MTDFRRITETMYASPQIMPGDLAAASAQGVTMIINNRPDDEAPGQPSGAEIAATARALGMDYRAIPVSSAGFSLPQVDEMQAALDAAEGPVLAFCRSGTRSTILWALAQAKAGADLDAVAEQARAAGYDTSTVRPTMEMLHRQSGG